MQLQRQYEVGLVLLARLTSGDSPSTTRDTDGRGIEGHQTGGRLGWKAVSILLAEGASSPGLSSSTGTSDQGWGHASTILFCRSHLRGVSKHAKRVQACVQLHDGSPDWPVTPHARPPELWCAACIGIPSDTHRQAGRDLSGSSEGHTAKPALPMSAAPAPHMAA